MNSQTLKKIAITGGIAIAIVVAVLLAFRIAYWDRILPGVRVGSLYLGGLTVQEADRLIAQEASSVAERTTAVAAPNSSSMVEIPTKTLVDSYQTTTAAQTAYQVGRAGAPWQQAAEQVASLVGAQPANSVPVTLNQAAWNTIALQTAARTNTVAENARFVNSANGFDVKADTTGTRLVTAQLYADLKHDLGNFSAQPTTVATYQLQPPLTAAALSEHEDFFAHLAKRPITLQTPQKNWLVPAETVLSWLIIGSDVRPVIQDPFKEFYPLPAQVSGPSFNSVAVQAFVENLAKEINAEPANAQLTFTDKLVVTKPSTLGQSLDVATSAQRLLQSLNDEASSTVELAVAVKKPEISEESLASLGINELISEGVSYFPGSAPERMQNVRTGAAQFQNAIIKPNQVFSFGEIMGYVGPETGYAPSKVILDGRQEFEYGGGMCQVSSTAFRAALNAGFPIVQRTNHAFQVNYYTQPYGVPGVDATVYYPAVDFKFRNDTPHHLLIQTEMVGTTLKFRYYSTKTKSGVVRGPNFVTGSLDPNAPSQTVFYRDVMVDGQVTKTDTFTTYYKSALEFPQSN